MEGIIIRSMKIKTKTKIELELKKQTNS